MTLTVKSIYFVFQSTFMIEDQDPVAALSDIRSMMERSSRFISLSGLSGVGAGVIALMGAYWAYRSFGANPGFFTEDYTLPLKDVFKLQLITIASVTLIGAILAGLFFTYLKSRKLHLALWDSSSRRMLINLGIPLIAGGFFILRLIDRGDIGMIAPACLIFYGLALVNASKYTYGDIRYLGYIEIVLGLGNLLALGKGLYFWAAGFGIAHILYGVFMWNRYDNVKTK